MKRGIRKPREIKNKIYPLVQVDPEGKIWSQGTPSGKWVRVPPKRALMIASRLTRAAKFALAVRRQA